MSCKNCYNCSYFDDVSMEDTNFCTKFNHPIEKYIANVEDACDDWKKFNIDEYNKALTDHLSEQWWGKI